MIRILVTDSEYLLEISPKEKERARKIDGRNWDPKRRCWVYPKNEEIRKGLIREFVDDMSEENLQLLEKSLTGASLQAPENIEVLKEANALLHAEIENLQKNDHTQTQLKEQLIQKDKILKELSDEKESLHRLYDLALKDLRELELVSLEKEKKIKNYVEVIGSLKIDLRRKEQELQVLQDIRTQSLEKDKYIVRLMEAKAALETEVQKVRETPPQTKKISAARVELEQVIEFKNISIIQMKRLAINLALQSREFETFINSQNDIDLRFISNFSTFMEKRFKDLLNISPLEKITLFQLIEKAKDKNILTQGEACLANFLRIERNRMIHDDTFTSPLRRHLYRYVIIAAILWQEIEAKFLKNSMVISSI